MPDRARPGFTESSNVGPRSTWVIHFWSLVLGYGKVYVKTQSLGRQISISLPLDLSSLHPSSSPDTLSLLLFLVAHGPPDATPTGDYWRSLQIFFDAPSVAASAATDADMNSEFSCSSRTCISGLVRKRPTRSLCVSVFAEFEGLDNGTSGIEPLGMGPNLRALRSLESRELPSTSTAEIDLYLS